MVIGFRTWLSLKNKRVSSAATNFHNGFYSGTSSSLPARTRQGQFVCNAHLRGIRTTRVRNAYPRLTPQQATNILKENEFTHEITTFPGSVKSFETNQLASNSPIEDSRAEARCLLTTGMLFGIFDGHGGSACGQVIAKRLFKYIATSLLPPDILHQYIESINNGNPMGLLEIYNDNYDFVNELKTLYHQSFMEYLKKLAENNSNGQKNDFFMKDVLTRAFLQLDEDMSQEAIPGEGGKINTKTLSVAMSGAVACVAHVDGPHLHVASAGDCAAVLGVLGENNNWIARCLTKEHNSNNVSEVERVLSEHPKNEHDTVIKLDRLLGQLAPLRAFGDLKYKWKKELIKKTLLPYAGEQALPPNYYTPPYLTAMPEVTHHRLTPRDKFLIIASDGLWELISPMQVIRFVGEYMSGKMTLNPVRLPRRNMKLTEINSLLLQRKEGLQRKPVDTNSATHLIRNALGGTEYGVDHGRLSQLLTIPEDMVRLFRDDISITVVFFDSEYLRHCPA